MPSQPEKHLYEYAVVRFVPRVEREEFINIGLVMMCKRRRWVRAEIEIDASKVAALAPEADMDMLRRQVESFRRIAAGDTSPIGSLEAHERFRWLTAVRSACVATSRPHPGVTSDLDVTFDALMNEQVR